MGAHRLAEMTYEDVSALSGALAVLPVGALEAHGPHLPLSTDVVIAEAMAEAGARRLSEAGFEVVLLPALQLTTADFAAGFPGTVSVRSDTVSTLVFEVGRSLARNGFSALALANAHFDPDHLWALRDATARLRAEGVRVVFPDVTRRALAERLGDEFRSGACHAGRYESSVVLAERADLVRRELLPRLPANPISLGRAIREGKRTFEEAGGPRAYFGAPAEATAEEGERTVATLGAILAEAVLEEMGPLDHPTEGSR